MERASALAENPFEPGAFTFFKNGVKIFFIHPINKVRDR